LHVTIQPEGIGGVGEKSKTHLTWYEPFSTSDNIQSAVDFALSQDISGLCTVGDPEDLPVMLQACKNYSPITKFSQESLIESGSSYKPLFE